MMRMSAATRMTVLMATTMTWIENFVEWRAAEKFSEHFLGIAEDERESAEDEVVFERIMCVSSSMVVVAVVCFIVS